MVATKLIHVPVKLFTMHNQAELLYGTNKVRKMIFRLAFGFFGYTPVAICGNVKESLQREFGLNSGRIKKVHNGVDMKAFSPRTGGQESEQIRLITTGTMYPIKNHAMIIRAFEKVHKKNPNTHLTILGDGQDREMLERLVRDMHMENAVSMPGIQKDVCSYLQKADIYVSASLTEGLPLSILEAMACGLPVVATDAGGTVDIVSTGTNGIVVAKNNLDAMVDALDTMIADEAMRKQYAERSLRIAKEWSIENCVRGYEELYMENDR